MNEISTIKSVLASQNNFAKQGAAPYRILLVIFP